MAGLLLHVLGTLQVTTGGRPIHFESDEVGELIRDVKVLKARIGAESAS